MEKTQHNIGSSMGMQDCIFSLIDFEYHSIELSPPFTLWPYTFSKWQYLDIESRDDKL